MSESAQRRSNARKLWRSQQHKIAVTSKCCFSPHKDHPLPFTPAPGSADLRGVGHSTPTRLPLLPAAFPAHFSLPPQLAVPVLGMWLTPRQLENHRDVLEKLLAELSQDTPDGTARRLISAAGVLPFPPLTSSSSPRYLYSSKGFSVMSAHFAECSDTPAALVFVGGLFPLWGAVCAPEPLRAVGSIAALPSSSLLLSQSSVSFRAPFPTELVRPAAPASDPSRPDHRAPCTGA